MALNYGTSTSITIGSAIGGLANSTTSVVQTEAVTTPTTNNIVDCIVRVTIKGAGTVASPFAANVFVFGSEDGTTFPDDATATVTTGALTLSANGSNLTAKFLGQVAVPTAASYDSQPWSIAAAFGGILPRKWGLIIQNQTGASLDATASNHTASYTPVYYN